MSTKTIRPSGPVDLTSTGAPPRSRRSSPHGGSRVPVHAASVGETTFDSFESLSGFRQLDPSSPTRPRPMERTSARAPELRNKTKGVSVARKEAPPPSAPSVGDKIRSVWRSKPAGKKARIDKTLISRPVATAPTVVTGFQVPRAPKPQRPDRPVGHPSIPGFGRDMTRDGAHIVVPQVSSHADVKIRRSMLGTVDEWKSSNPPRQPVDNYRPRPTEAKEASRYAKPSIVGLDEVRYQRARDSASNWSTTAVISEPIGETSDDAKDQIGAAVSYTSFPEPPPEPEMTNKQSRRRGILFGPGDFPDPTCFAGQDYDDEDDLDDAGFDDEQPEIVTESESGPAIPTIILTPPSPTRKSSVVSNKHLSIGSAWKTIAETERRRAELEAQDAEDVLAYCAPLIAAFEVVKAHPEFEHLDSWEGIEDVLEKILEERDTATHERDRAIAAAVWFKKQWKRLLRERSSETDAEDTDV
ncbi:hypothetical protein BJ170DRAFT_679896 [Xylariales sp. AK1849]|nr:hypothetical protein BJ170DRAFT_679896 [Xylariales sp. AK1849]